MLTVLLAAALLAQDQAGFTDEDIARMERQWNAIAAERAREEAGAGKRPAGEKRQQASRPARGPNAQGGPLRPPRPPVKRPRPAFIAVYPRVLPPAFTIPPFIRR